MKIKLIFLFVILFNKIAFCQYDMQWHVGACTFIDFRGGNMIITASSDSIEGYTGCNVCLCDIDSNLMLFSNGATVYRPDASLMPGGDTLNTTHFAISEYPFSSPSSQGIIIINKPGNDSIYYLLHETIDNDTLIPIVNNIYCTTINLNADSGRGVVVSKGQIFYSSPDSLLHGKLQAVKHANGRDWWLISKKSYSNDLLEWLITSDTVVGPTVINFSGPIGLDSYYAQACFSNDGNHYALISWNEAISLFDFDRCTGGFNMIFNENFYDSIGPGGGVAFSFNNRFLYATNSQYCYQFDLLSSNIWASRAIVGTYDGLVVSGIPYDFQRIKLAPDKKIYISPGSTNDQWSVINSPDSLGMLCDLQQHTIQLYCYNNMAFPNLPNFNLGPVPFSQCDTINGINEIENYELKVFPNPCTEILKIDLSKIANHSGALKIYNSMGQLFIHKKINQSGSEISVDVSRLPGGVYYILVEGEFAIMRQSFVKL